MQKWLPKTKNHKKYASFKIGLILVLFKIFGLIGQFLTTVGSLQQVTVSNRQLKITDSGQLLTTNDSFLAFYFVFFMAFFRHRSHILPKIDKNWLSVFQNFEQGFAVI